MRQTAAIMMMVVVAAVLTGCGDGGHEAIVKESISKGNEFVSVLETVKDKASAAAAKPKIKAIIEDMKAIETRMKAMDKPDAATQEALKKKYEADMNALTAKVKAAMMKIVQNSEAIQEFQDIIKDLQGVAGR